MSDLLTFYWNRDFQTTSDPSILFHNLKLTKLHWFCEKQVQLENQHTFHSSIYTSRFDLQPEDWFNADITSKTVVNRSYKISLFKSPHKYIHVHEQTLVWPKEKSKLILNIL